MTWSSPGEFTKSLAFVGLLFAPVSNKNITFEITDYCFAFRPSYLSFSLAAVNHLLHELIFPMGSYTKHSMKLESKVKIRLLFSATFHFSY